MFTLIISAFRNNVKKTHLHSLHRSEEIKDNVLKFYFLLHLQAIHCRIEATLETVTSSVAETTESL
jgi:hypothetical protein